MPSITYWDYLKIENLLSLQMGLASNEKELSNDELHFIIVHQVTELWFKLILSEIRAARDKLITADTENDNTRLAALHLDRVNKTLEVASRHWSLVETMAAQSFLEFRDKLFPASGSQSFQFPEIEIVLGLEESLIVSTGAARSLDHLQKISELSNVGADGWRRIEKARGEKTYCSALYDWLYQTRIFGSGPGDKNDEEIVNEFLIAYKGIIYSYHNQQIEQAKRELNLKDEILVKKYQASCAAAEEILFALDQPIERRKRVKRLRAGVLFVESYCELPDNTFTHALIEKTIELEHSLVFWRCRHARAAERMIGRRIGTGGFSVNYLDQTLSYRIFTELLACRTQLAPRQLLLPLSSWSATSKKT